MKALITLLVAGAISAPAIASPTCYLEVNDLQLLGGACDATRLENDGLLIGDGKGVSALIKPRQDDPDRAIGAYTSGGITHDLDFLRRDGMSCWRGVGVRLCVWGVQ